jgi:membrane-associated phospholipid phosphatase
LFFSGHTANLALLAFMVDIKWLKYILGICTFIVAVLLLVQHVHYTIDVLVAPFAAYISYKLAKSTEQIIYKRIKATERVSRKVIETA